MFGAVGFSIFLLSYFAQSQENSTLVEVPLLAPYKLSELDDPFKKFESSEREYIRSFFTPAYYESKCEGLPEAFIEPVYYWPGDNLALRCVVCVEDFAKNGVAKNWAVFQNNIPESIVDLEKTLKVDKYGNEQWLILDESGAETLRKNNTVISFIPGGKYDPNNVKSDTRERRPQMTFEQRDGYLIINNTDISNYGIYRCFDKESRYLLQYIYYLIPITPIYTSVGFNEYSNECESEVNKDFWRLDGYHQYRFYPRLLINSNNSDCGSKCASYSFDEAKLNTTPIAFVKPESKDPEIIIKKFNLEIFLHWSPWTTCENNRTARTRSGFCHIRKIDPNRKFNSDNSYNMYTWLLPIHKLLENVKDFRENGIMLFSGVMGSLLLKDQVLPQHCTAYPRQTWDEMRKAIINPLMEKTVNATMKDGVKIFAGLCFRKVQYNVEKYLIFGEQLFQNERCSK